MTTVEFTTEYRSSCYAVTGVPRTELTSDGSHVFPAYRCSECRRVFIVSTMEDLAHECTGNCNANTTAGSC